MTLNTKEQELLDTWNKIQEGKEKKENVSGIYYNFQQTLSELIETQVRMESGEGDALTDEEKETFNAYDKLFNYEVNYGFRCSYSASASDYDHSGDCSHREELIAYLNGSDTPEDPDFQELVYSCDWDMDFYGNEDFEPQIGVYGFKLKEIYQNITPKNVVAPIKETKKFQIVLELEDHTEENDFNAYAIGVKDYLNFADNEYKVVSAVVSSEE